MSESKLNAPHFNGPAYSPTIDHARLTDQHKRVKGLMGDGMWRTLREIADTTGDPEASVSAQLRHLKKPRFGSFVIERRSRGERKSGLYEYRMLPPGSGPPPKTRRNKFREALVMVWNHPDVTAGIRQAIKQFLEG